MQARFMHLADIHLGYAQYGSAGRYNDYYRSFSAAITHALEAKVDFVIIAGDLFHQRTLSPQTLLQAAHELERLRAGSIPAIGIMGNHEQPHYRDKVSWLDFLAGRGLMTLLNANYINEQLALTPHDGQRGSYIDLAGIRIYGIPYCGAVLPRLLADTAACLAEEATSERPAFTILMAHAGLEGIIPNFAAHMTREQLAGLRPHIDYLALGHIHRPYREDGWIFNPGSLEPTSFPESECRGGALIVEVDTDRSPAIRSASRPFWERPFLRLPVAISEFETPDALYAGVEAHLAACEQPTRRPVVELTLEGVLQFSRLSLQMERIEALVQEALNPIVAQVRSHATSAEYEVSADAGRLSREELEIEILTDLVARDARYREEPARWAELVRDLKHLALERTSPETISAHLQAGIDRITRPEQSHADPTH